MTKVNAIGLMSGSSLDGLDIAYCQFNFEDNKWNYSILKSETIEYENDLQKELLNASKMNAFDFVVLNQKLGQLFGKSINDFIVKHRISRNEIDLISSHGHTIFHQPKLGFSTQIGCGATINAISEIKTICDFRSTDVALNGQGAPLVPVGDKLLFSEYESCLNLGGIANISFSKNETRQAYDICFANLPLNYICQTYFNTEYDKEGLIGVKGSFNNELLSQLESMVFYSKSKPKSLGREDFENDILPLLSNVNPEDIMATFYEHFTNVIALELNLFKNCLITGGGAYNSHFMKLLQSKTSCEIILPNSKLVEFKEALIFAFLGVLNHSKEINILKEVTGARQSSISGATYDAFN